MSAKDWECIIRETRGAFVPHYGPTLEQAAPRPVSSLNNCRCRGWS
jgi:hypothetical protein